MAAAGVSSVVSSQDATLQRNVFVKIVEEPASKALRFRYECEGRSAGSLPGASSTQDKKSFPKIQVVGHRGRAVVVVSCVTVDPPYRPHPHNLVGKEGCKKGVCTMEIANEDMTCEFSNLGIQCVKKKDIEDSLKIREEIRVDPFRTGFQHKTQPGSIDLNSVRLCFQVFLEGPERGQFKVPLKPVVSEPIYDKKAINDLTIMKLSDCTSPVMGNKEIILLCDKVSKDDIEIRFYEENEENGSIVWESFGDFQPSDVHKQYAICFRTPQYHNLEITSPARVFVQLRCPSKDTTSAPRPFQYIPLLTSGTCKRKWNLLSFSSAYGSYMTSPSSTTPLETSTAKKHKAVELEDILSTEEKVEPIYDRLNEFMGIGKTEQEEPQEDVYDVDLDLISQIIRNQEELDGVNTGKTIHELELLEHETELFAGVMEMDVLNGNEMGRFTNDSAEQLSSVTVVDQPIQMDTEETVVSVVAPAARLNANITQQQTPTPPTRPPKKIQETTPQTTPTGANAPPLPPKKSTPTKTSPTKQSPATFLKNLLFSPTKKNKKEKHQVSPPSTNATPQTNDPAVGPYELTEQLGLYVDNEAPLATASEFGDDEHNTAQHEDPSQFYYCSVNNNRDTDLKRKRQKYENANAISQYFNINKRPRQNSYPPVASPPMQSPQNMSIQPGISSPLHSPMTQQPPQMHSPMHPPAAATTSTTPQNMYGQSPTQPIQLMQNVYVKQEPNVLSSPPPQYYYEMMAAQQQQSLVQQQPQMVQYSGGGIINPSNQDGVNDQLNSDFSLPNLSDVNLSLLDQHLSQNLNDMNINNF